MYRILKTYAALLLVFCVLLIAACDAKSEGGSLENENPTETQSENAGNADEAPEAARIYPDLPQSDFGGYEFRILSRGPDYNVHWYAKDIYAEEENGDPINDAVHKRNKTVEEKYGVKIINIPENGDLASRASRSIKANDDAFDMVCHGLSQINALMADGYFYDLGNFPYIDLKAPWWDQKATEQLTITGKLFATVGNYLITDKDATWIIMFNKKVLKDNSLDDPYRLVQNGTWTMDKMLEMMKAVAKDLNGDAKMDDNDQWGLVSQYRNSLAFYNGAGEYTAKMNASGQPEIALYNPRAVDICERIFELQANTDITINADEYISKYPGDRVWDDMQLVVFNTDRALFYYAGMNRVTLLRDMETDFGIIPPPKYDESQSGYYPSVEVGCTSSVAVPVTVPDKERAGIIIEALCAESQYTLLPAYYDISLKTKFARDDESSEMLDLIFANRLYDIGHIYNWGDITGFFYTPFHKGTNNITSFWEKNEAKAAKALEKTIDKFEQIEQ
ncbi:MAG: extracellular solute-binding protein [Oscillospiraceae bacterium]|nr:extracellular solute-binding protein [Oscillospiraceae bacterium]